MSRAWGSAFLPPSAPEDFSALIGAVLLGLAAWGLWRQRKTAGPGELFLLGNLAIHAFWPWWYDRYFLTLLPFLLISAAHRLENVSRRFRLGILAGLAVFSFTVHGRHWMAAKPDMRPPQEEAYEWIRGRTDPSALFTSPFYAREALHTGRIFLPLPLAKDTGLFQYVWWEGLPDMGFSTAEISPAAAFSRWGDLLKDPALFRPVFQGSGVTLYRRVSLSSPQRPNPGPKNQPSRGPDLRP
jgi:hypothetical protein